MTSTTPLWNRAAGEGHRRGAETFADEFADLTQPSHGECGPDCWCHLSADEADACLAERTGGTGGGSGSQR